MILIVLAVEGPQRDKKTVGPAGRGIAVVAENLELPTDIGNKLLRVLLLGLVGLGLILGALLKLLFQGGRRDDLHNPLLP